MSHVAHQAWLQTGVGAPVRCVPDRPRCLILHKERGKRHPLLVAELPAAFRAVALCTVLEHSPASGRFFPFTQFRTFSLSSFVLPPPVPFFPSPSLPSFMKMLFPPALEVEITKNK